MADNPALHQACMRAAKASKGVVGVYVICPEQMREHDMASVRVGFLLRCLEDLSKRLQQHRIPLRILCVDSFAEVPAALLGLAAELGADAIYANRELEWNEQRRDERVEEQARAAGVKFLVSHDQTVIEPGTLQTGSGGDYQTFTPFKKRWLKVVSEDGLPPALPAPARQRRLPCPPDPVPSSVPGFDPAADLPALWPAGEAEALRRLQSFLDKPIRSYGVRRDLPAVAGTSTLSPYLAVGAIAMTTCLRAAMALTGNKHTDTWIDELIWREFYRNVLFCFPRVSRGQAFRFDVEPRPWRDDPAQFEAWCQGRTGFPFVDAGMRELLATGWMHNRLRMVTAMFLTKHLLIDWRQGERWFMQHLVDGDLANNNGGWQWCASTGTDAAPYFRIFNPFSQSKRFDPDGDYIRRWVPELRQVPAAALHDPRKLAACGVDSTQYPQYPSPIVEHAAARERALAAFGQ
jgi:deoxyribodipyrimidine photo-lyase